MLSSCPLHNLLPGRSKAVAGLLLARLGGLPFEPMRMEDTVDSVLLGSVLLAH